ncbi:MAG: formate dehydrogenase accessory sulfurtransferase FdhD, partial [Phycisphaerae bacterium]|nr:formate dehydrogenase accessory sulfurtransferase FdhD [Phycisphaerae bacterium]
GQPLVIQQPGGVGGGRSMLSEHGRYMMQSFREMQDRVRGLADAWFSEITRRGTNSTPAATHDPATDGPRLASGTQRVTAVQVSSTGASAIRRPCDVAVETVVAVRVVDVGEFTLTCTPTDLEALTIGWALHAGLISGLADVVEQHVTHNPPAVEIWLADDRRSAARAGVASGCPHPVRGDSMRVSPSLLLGVARQMWATQAIFQQTGGAHAAGIFQEDGTILALGQDIGRHHAFDKAVGQCLLEGGATAGQGIMLSGRVSLELVSKAARAGIELISAVSAPSSLAIETAQRANITLCGFVRDTRATVFTHPRRVVGTPEP